MRPDERLDPAIINLCNAINEFECLHTIESCQGYIDDHRPDEPWIVIFQPCHPITQQAYSEIEFLAWLINNDLRPSLFPSGDVMLGLNSPPPYLNGIGETMYFYIQGRGYHPDELADTILAERYSAAYDDMAVVTPK